MGVKLQGEIKNKDQVINEYGKIINSTKREYQKLNAENVSYKEILQQEQKRLQKEEELKQYQKEKRLYDSMRCQEQRKLLTKSKHSNISLINLYNVIYRNADYSDDGDRNNYFTKKRTSKRKEYTISNKEQNNHDDNEKEGDEKENEEEERKITKTPRKQPPPKKIKKPKRKTKGILDYRNQ